MSWRGGGWRARGSRTRLRYGANLAPVQFESDWDYSGAGIIYNTALSLANPLGGYGTGGSTAAFLPQGRYTNTYQFSDNASLMLGRPRAADRRQLAAQPREPVQLRRHRTRR